jgi:hypothetical protein
MLNKLQRTVCQFAPEFAPAAEVVNVTPESGFPFFGKRTFVPLSSSLA